MLINVNQYDITIYIYPVFKDFNIKSVYKINNFTIICLFIEYYVASKYDYLEKNIVKAIS